jgi:hypothetical protein
MTTSATAKSRPKMRVSTALTIPNQG